MADKTPSSKTGGNGKTRKSRNKRKGKKSSVNISSLPDTVLLEIFSHLIFTDLCSCALVCREWYRLSKDFTLKKVIRVSKPISKAQLLSLVSHHFSCQLSEFEIVTNLSTADSSVMGKSDHVLCSMDWDILRTISLKCKNLRKIVLMHCFFVRADLGDFPASVVHLSVRGSRMCPDSFFVKNLHCFVPNLVCLDLGGVNNFLTSQELHRLNSLTSLRALFLQDCYRINSGGIEAIIDILPQLEVLDLEGTDVANVSMLFTHCANLQYLYLGNLHFADFLYLSFKPDMLPSLRELCFCNITPDVRMPTLVPFILRQPRREKLTIRYSDTNRTSSENPENLYLEVEDKNIAFKRVTCVGRFGLSCGHYSAHGNYGLE